MGSDRMLGYFCTVVRRLREDAFGSVNVVFEYQRGLQPTLNDMFKQIEM